MDYGTNITLPVKNIRKSDPIHRIKLFEVKQSSLEKSLSSGIMSVQPRLAKYKERVSLRRGPCRT